MSYVKLGDKIGKEDYKPKRYFFLKMTTGKGEIEKYFGNSNKFAIIFFYIMNRKA